MVEFQQIPSKGAVRSALAGLKAPAHEQPALAVREIWPFTATQIAWGKGADLAALAEVLTVASLPSAMDEGFAKGRGEVLILPLRPRRVLRLAPVAPTKAEMDKVTQMGAYLLDLSAGRVLLEVQGRHWAWALRKGGGLDFEAFAPNRVAQTALFKVSTLIWMEKPGAVKLLLPYSYTRALVEKLIDAAQDQGIAL